MKKIRVISCITTIMIMALIFFFSSQNGEESNTVSKSFTAVTVRAVVSLFVHDGNRAEVIVTAIHHFVRKMAHFTIYMSLGISSFTMWYSNLKKTKPKTVIYTLLLCGAYAATDEFHQLFIDGRTGSVKDILIDTSGALTGAVICVIILIAAEIISARRR